MTNEEKIGAKICGPETGIEIRHTMCDICTPGPQCGIDAFVKDGKVIKVQGTKGYPGSDGKLCAKGAASRQYIYRDDRIRQPLRRVGPRGSGKFEPISWEEALTSTAEALNRVKAESGPEAVAFLCGYSKWFRSFLKRLAFSFGSPNYLTESSACHEADVCARKTLFGTDIEADFPHADMIVCWGANPSANIYPLARLFRDKKKQGCRFLVIDPRNTQSAQKLADFYLRPRLGTDGALAHAMANHIIEKGLCDAEYIARHIHGFEQYREYAARFDLKTAEAVTGVPAADIARAAEMLAESGAVATMTGTSLTHRRNGYNNVRAILALSAITGQFDRKGGLLPAEEYTFAHSRSGFVSRQEEFENAVRPRTVKKGVGLERFPLWEQLVDQCQGMDLANQIFSGKPYPLRAATCFGVNHMMYPDSKRFLSAMDHLDFIVTTDLFMTEMCRHADIVLPARTSFERREIKLYGRRACYIKPAIEPVWDSRDDVTIMAQLAEKLGLEDELLRSGYDACARYMLEPAGFDWEAFWASDGPVPVPNHTPAPPAGSALFRGLSTPSGKIELYSERIARLGVPGLDPLPVYADSDDDADPEAYPFVMCAGARLPNAIHSRFHGCQWTRSLRPEPMVDINPADAEALGLATGDEAEVSTPQGTIRLKANVTELANRGELHSYHGYAEANVNDLISADHLDPYTGFPGYKQFRCAIRKPEKGE